MLTNFAMLRKLKEVSIFCPRMLVRTELHSPFSSARQRTNHSIKGGYSYNEDLIIYLVVIPAFPSPSCFHIGHTEFF